MFSRKYFIAVPLIMVLPVLGCSGSRFNKNQPSEYYEASGNDLLINPPENEVGVNLVKEAEALRESLYPVDGE